MISILLGVFLAFAAGPAAACGDVSRETPTVTRGEITVAIVREMTPLSDTDRADADTVCHLSSVCASVDRAGGSPALGSKRVERSPRSAGFRGESRPAAPPLPPPRTTFRI